jgi:hypothetical protein
MTMTTVKIVLQSRGTFSYSEIGDKRWIPDPLFYARKPFSFAVARRLKRGRYNRNRRNNPYSCFLSRTFLFH